MLPDHLHMGDRPPDDMVWVGTYTGWKGDSEIIINVLPYGSLHDEMDPMVRFEIRNPPPNYRPLRPMRQIEATESFLMQYLGLDRLILKAAEGYDINPSAVP